MPKTFVNRFKGISIFGALLIATGCATTGGSGQQLMASDMHCGASAGTVWVVAEPTPSAVDMSFLAPQAAQSALGRSGCLRVVSSKAADYTLTVSAQFDTQAAFGFGPDEQAKMAGGMLVSAIPVVGPFVFAATADTSPRKYITATLALTDRAGALVATATGRGSDVGAAVAAGTNKLLPQMQQGKLRHVAAR